VTKVRKYFICASGR
jgi:hypothetical protein